MTPQGNSIHLEFSLKPVTSEDDVPALAEINERALDDDPQFKEWVRLFTERTEYEAAAKAVTEALTDPTYHVLKAVVPDSESPTGEKIIGFAHWMCGYIVLDKVDPFAKSSPNTNSPASATDIRDPTLNVTDQDIRDPTSNVAEELAAKAHDLEKTPSQTQANANRAARLRAGEAKYVETRNHYIATIRGKKHMFIRRLMVLPEYQRRGIASRLMTAITDEADRQKIVCWLFSRPVGEKLYLREGFVTIAVTEMDEKDFDFVCARTKAMMRSPQSPNQSQFRA